MITYSLFIVDDEDTIRRTLEIALEGRYRLADFPDAESAIAAAQSDPPDLVLLDIGLPGMRGIEATPVFKAMAPGILIIVITAYEDVQSVVSAMKCGAYDYVVKPLNIDTLEVSIGNALETVRLKKEVQALQERYLRENLPCFIGESNTIKDVMEFVGLLARSPDTPVLILGETGTGKEMIASALHYRSPNFRGPLISVNCAAIPRELIESELFGYERGAFSGAHTAGKKGMVEQGEGGTSWKGECGWERGRSGGGKLSAWEIRISPRTPRPQPRRSSTRFFLPRESISAWRTNWWPGLYFGNPFERPD